MKTLSYAGSRPRSDRDSEESLSGSLTWPGANSPLPEVPVSSTRWKSRAPAGPTPQDWGQSRPGNKHKMIVEKVQNYTNVQDCYSFSTSVIYLFPKVLGLDDFTTKWFISEKANARCSHIFSIRKIKHELIVYLGDLEAGSAFKEDHLIKRTLVSANPTILGRVCLNQATHWESLPFF